MSITINGTTNTLTAPSGLAVAGNTAVTGTLSATGVITKTNTAATLSNFFNTTGSTTEGAYARASNTSGTLQWGIEGAVGGGTLTGASAYSGFIGTVTNTDFHIQHNNTVVGTFSATALTLGSGVNLVGAGSLISSGANTVVAASQTVVDNSSSVARFIAFGPDAGTNATVRLLSVRSDGSGSVPYDFGPTSLTMPTGVNLVMASGQGIDFSATSNGSGTTTSEVLSDYEEGTWTPALGGTGGASGITYSARSGTYTKIGRQVTIQGSVTLSAKTSITGSVIISDLPFNVAAGIAPGLSVGYWTAMATNWVSLSGYAEPGTGYVVIGGRKTAGTGFEFAADADISATTRIDFSTTYFV